MNENRAEILRDFYESPDKSLFNQKTVAVVTLRSEKTLERDRWEGYGIKFSKIGRSVRYQKKDILDWLDKHQSVCSTSEVSANAN